VHPGAIHRLLRGITCANDVRNSPERAYTSAHYIHEWEI
jgi:hypothetical protein